MTATPRFARMTSASLRSAMLRVALLTVAAPTVAAAQGTLSTQGFGYPVGPFSIRSVGTGGSFGEFDAISPVNPASIAGVQRAVLTAQTEPEFRTLKVGSVSESNRIQRVPLLLAAFSLPRNFGLALSAASFLDRSFSTATTGEANLGDEVVPTNDQYDVRGSMSDMRAAVGYRVNERLSVGIGGHVIVGSNDVVFARRFVDSIRFGSVVDTSTATYQGSALSIGADYRVLRNLSVAASYRHGNSLEARAERELAGSAKVPSRLGATARYTGIPGSVFAFGLEQVNWSAMNGLGSASSNAEDALNWHAGAEVAGPSLRSVPVQFRAGYARAQLPFGVGDREVKEHRIAGGIGIPLDRNLAASIDLSIQRVMRSVSGLDARENAWRFGLGVQIRP